MHAWSEEHGGNILDEHKINKKDTTVTKVFTNFFADHSRIRIKMDLKSMVLHGKGRCHDSHILCILRVDRATWIMSFF